MYHLQRDTLAYLKSRPLFRKVNAAETRLPQFVEAVNQYLTDATKQTFVSVEESALMFYMGNHAFSELCKLYEPDQPLPPHVLSMAKWYVDYALDAGQRLLYYIMIVTTREARHLKSGVGFTKTLNAMYGKQFTEFRSNLNGTSNHAVSVFRNSPVDMPVGKYTEAIRTVFNDGSFGSGFGGKPWGNIADNAHRFFSGEISLEGMADTAWTLAHNNGPMFNKNILFHQPAGDLIKILDVQRSGQIPQLIHDYATTQEISGMTHDVIARWKRFREIIGDSFDGSVDWRKVADAGCKGSYAAELVKQKKLQKSKPQVSDQVYLTESGDFVTKAKRKAA